MVYDRQAYLVRVIELARTGDLWRKTMKKATVETSFKENIPTIYDKLPPQVSKEVISSRLAQTCLDRIAHYAICVT